MPPTGLQDNPPESDPHNPDATDEARTKVSRLDDVNCVDQKKKTFETAMKTARRAARRGSDCQSSNDPQRTRDHAREPPTFMGERGVNEVARF